MEKYIEKLLRGGPLLQLLDQQGKTIMERYNLKKVDISILYYLSINGEHNTGRDIQAFFHLNKGYISQTVDGLQKKGYLTAVPDGNDRRLIHYSVTEMAETPIRETKQMWEDINTHIFVGITEDEMAVFQQIMCKVENNIREMLERGGGMNR